MNLYFFVLKEEATYLSLPPFNLILVFISRMEDTKTIGVSNHLQIAQWNIRMFRMLFLLAYEAASSPVRLPWNQFLTC
ncbi:hypothetical protein SRABI80_00379 [Peribacillus frigoritolerans]|nr:hypothetical protein SRABI80_00379 [Peribacillus frigoritolerans]